ncbi:amidohydrolase family protein [Aliirhizobium cellulosilyticum]|uniref:Cytosine/adenosine deaminase-related metal-dependent hydrolase n=1 Tax=Aliirhizobium cellulosilyticum TaxID=393664 RepID=A0A7W6XBJ2_9HYPH|nr:amidohydrolase family protein [Rhizobium cellulosilyticum]MBB4349599.1 cytosine/adenosine deaminase-related metal-dependent hydrolase [Rhizobium cellulosilyticum]MBB4412179.1 cytosine/adenosine deaminase-related metal-dependent hydrolase [Rhizobium cellulosilyticum]MBB4446810.1 cytosine/adenosine deaminase-related metal-dependent hydrolase [Rhizobium cellulosilyticum]
MSDLLIKNARPMGGEASDILIRDGLIAAIGPGLADEGIATEDAGGRIAIPGLVDAHTHLDKSLLGYPWYVNEVGPRLIDKIDNERKVKRDYGLDAHVQSMRQSLQSVGYGTTLIRTHVDIDTDQGLVALEGVMETRRQLAGVVEIEIVAFPQSGLLRRPGTVELLDQAMAMGADLVGGLDPCGMDRDPKGHLDTIFALAEKYGKGIDIHLHEGGELGAFSMELIFERIRAFGMQGKVAVSHAFCLGMPDWNVSQGLIDTCAELDVPILTTAPPSREVPSLKRLRAAGVRFGAGVDGFRDTWGPYGNGDMLERAMLLGMKNNLRRDDELLMALDVCTTGGALAMDRANHVLAVGGRGDVVIVEGESVGEAIVTHQPRKLVVTTSNVVARDGKSLRERP